MKKNKERLFSTDSVDDDMFMSTDLHIDKSIKDGVDFVFERQSGIKTRFTLYIDGVESLRDFLNRWLEDNNNS